MLRPVRLFLLFLCVYGLCSVSASSVYAAGPPIEVFADQVELNLNTQVTSFSKNVRILFDPWQARCEQAQVFVDPKSKQVTKITMSGNVLIQRGASILKGQRVILDVRSNQLKIEGQVYTRMQFERPLNLKLN